MARRVAIQEKYTIPSGGKIYKDENIPAEFTLRAMTTMEEKLRLSASGGQILPELVKSCVVSPEKVDTKTLKLFDLEFLIYKLRIVTYGPEYKIQVGCNKCGRIFDNTVDLDKLPVKSLPDEFEEPFIIGPLPVSGDKLSCRLLSSHDFENISNDCNHLIEKFPKYIGDPSMIIDWDYKIVSKNGEPVKSTLDTQKYIESMHARDFQYLDSKYKQVADGFGLDLNCTAVCPHCGEEVHYVLPVNDEFFRPTYNDR
jgi:hypothetical protein